MNQCLLYWSLTGAWWEIRRKHRADLHQALAYAFLADIAQVDTLLLCPLMGRATSARHRRDPHEWSSGQAYPGVRPLRLPQPRARGDRPRGFRELLAGALKVGPGSRVDRSTGL